MKRIKQIISGSSVNHLTGNVDISITGIALDSREVKPGYLFFALKGTNTDGHSYIEKAIKNGAVAVICEEIPFGEYNEVTFIKVKNSKKELGIVASKFYGNPSFDLKVIGVTGTNGKTSIATLLFYLFKKLGYRVGLISTIKYCIDEKEQPATHTTPDALKIQQLLSEMVNTGCEYCFMEVSSHAIHQERISGIQFTGGIFTNITHDHLDYHKTFSEYLYTKKRFFDNLKTGSFSVINIDDKNGKIMIQNTDSDVFTYSTRELANYQCRVLEKHFDGMLIEINNHELWTKFIGKFNAYNLLAVYGTAICLGQDKNEILSVISELDPVKGRFEIIRSPEGKYVIIDYAHTPDALKNVLNAISEIRTGKEQVITVVGAGGDRDKTKRPEMAHEAVIGSDKVIFTSDNPRSEDPDQIIEDMEKGVDISSQRKVLTIVNRKEAIKSAIILAMPGDIVLIAGKGHENYQEINGVKFHFDDREIVEGLFGL